jgi:hypothetical protein
MKRLLSILLTVVTLSPVTALALEHEGINLYPAVEYFSWEEHDQGLKLADEDGALYGLGVAGTVNLDESPLYIGMRGEVFSGELNRKSFAGDPLDPTQVIPANESDTSLLAVNAEATIGIRLPFEHLMVEPFGGVGFRWWQRRINNTTTQEAPPALVAGFGETWETYFTKVGVKLSWQTDPEDTEHNGLSLFAEGGYIYPFNVNTNSDATGFGWVKTEPDGKGSLLGEAGFEYKRFRTSFFYEGFRYDPSQAVLANTEAGLSEFAQPETKVDIVGIRIGILF